MTAVLCAVLAAAPCAARLVVFRSPGGAPVDRRGVSEACARAEAAGAARCTDPLETGAIASVLDDHSWSNDRIAIAVGAGWTVGDAPSMRDNDGIFHTPLESDARDAVLTTSYGWPAARRTLYSLEAGRHQHGRVPFHLEFLRQSRRGRARANEGGGGDDPPVTVYFVGDPVDPTTDDLRGRVTVLEPDPENARHSRSSCSAWRGNHIASLIAGTRYGVAPRASLVSVPVSSGCRSIVRSDDYLRALQTTLDARRRAARGAPAVALIVPYASTRRRDSTAIDAIGDIVAALARENVTIVAPAGDDGVDACDFVPQALPEVLVVGAVEVFRDRQRGRLAAVPWKPTNFGQCVDAWAPGVRIEAAFNHDRPAVFSGTSEAAALGAGVAASVAERMPSATPVGIRTAIAEAADAARLLVAPHPRPSTDRVLQDP